MYESMLLNANNILYSVQCTVNSAEAINSEILYTF